MTALLEVQHLSHIFGTSRAVDDVSLNIEAGSYTVLLGPSGSGKTTVLSVLGGFLQPNEGRVLINGVDCTSMPPAKRPTATVFQDYALFPHMTIGNNVAFGLRMRGQAKDERLTKARAMLELVGLETSFNKKPHQLSGGQRQRVALARALIVEPDVLLLDEPLGALDLKLRRQMQDELKAIQKRVGTAFVHVTHDQEEAMALADHIVVMNQGRIEDQGAPERVYGKPATKFTATFMGESTVLPARFKAAGQVETELGTFKCHGTSSTRFISIRPEHVKIGGAIPVKILDVVYQGSFKRVTAAAVNAPTIEILCRVSAETQVKVGEHTSVEFDPAYAIVLES
jgi:spermidine/putrescine transport system ATP-binding protein